MKFLCPSCKAKYQIADEKLAGRSVRMKCRKCSFIIQVTAATPERAPLAPAPKTLETALEVIEQARASGVTELNLSGYPLGPSVPLQLWRLDKVETLVLAGCSLGAPERVLSVQDIFRAHPNGGLPSLAALDLSDNPLLRFPSLKFPKLRSLSMRKTGLTEAPPPDCLPGALEVLDISENHIRALPNDVSALRRLKRLNLSGNPLGIPEEIIATEDASRICSYANQSKEQGQRLNEAKLLLVGQGGVGKTSLAKRLLGEAFSPKEATTEGIAIGRWSVRVAGENVRVNVWDFGGQEIMHATHQFFLTRRSIYVLVLNSRQSEHQNRLDYWLKIIESFGRGSPTIVVCNQSDQHRLELNWRGLQEKYPFVVAFVKDACCTSGQGVQQLQELITQQLEQLPHLRDEVPKSWLNIKSTLEASTQSFMSMDAYQATCAKQLVADAANQRALVEFLHDLGTLLNFYDDPQLCDMHVLNPTWVTGGVYTILNSHPLFQSKGHLKLHNLSEILDATRYPPHVHRFIVDIMRKFELCFPIPDSMDKELLVCDLLPREEPYLGESVGHLAFEYQYDVLPGSIVTRFIVGVHSLIAKGTLWRTGVVLEREGAIATVKADLEDARIRVFVSGERAARRRLLEVIRQHFSRINASVTALKVLERVPVPGYAGVSVSYQHLLTLERRGVRSFLPEGLDEEANVDEMLAGIDEPAPTATQEELVVEARRGSPWAAGSFYLVAFATVVGIGLAAYQLVSWMVLLPLLTFGMLATLLIGALQALHDGSLRQRGFLSALKQVLAQLPGARRRQLDASTGDDEESEAELRA